MTAKLKLVHDASKIAHPRPIQTYYFGVQDPTHRAEWARVGRAATHLGALRAAVCKVLIGQYKSADIYNDISIRVYKVRKKGNQLSVIGYFGRLEALK